MVGEVPSRRAHNRGDERTCTFSAAPHRGGGHRRHHRRRRHCRRRCPLGRLPRRGVWRRCAAGRRAGPARRGRRAGRAAAADRFGRFHRRAAAAPGAPRGRAVRAGRRGRRGRHPRHRHPGGIGLPAAPDGAEHQAHRLDRRHATGHGAVGRRAGQPAARRGGGGAPHVGRARCAGGDERRSAQRARREQAPQPAARRLCLAARRAGHGGGRCAALAPGAGAAAHGGQRFRHCPHRRLAAGGRGCQPRQHAGRGVRRLGGRRFQALLAFGRRQCCASSYQYKSKLAGAAAGLNSGRTPAAPPADRRFA